jgi:hypothetical protein
VSVMHFSDDYTDSEDPSETETESVESDPHTSDLEFIDDQSLSETSGSESDVDVSAEEMIVGDNELQLVFENVASGVVPPLDVDDPVVVKVEPVTPTVIVIENTVEKPAENVEGLSADGAGGEAEEESEESEDEGDDEDVDEDEEDEEEDEEDEDGDGDDDDSDDDGDDEDSDDDDDDEVREKTSKGVKRKRVSKRDPEFQAALLKIIKRAI